VFVKSVWTHPPGEFKEGPSSIAPVYKRLRDYGFNIIFPFVKHSNGAVTFPTKEQGIYTPPPGWDETFLEKMVEEAHRVGLEIHPVFVVFCEGTFKGWDVPSEPGLWLSQHRDCVQVDKKGKEILRWSCPTQETVRRHEKQVIMEVVEGYDVDGVQLDYIRYPEEGFGCYCNHCRAEFKATYGFDPVEVEQLDRRQALWLDWRAQGITSFVKELKAAILDTGKKVALSAAVFKNYPYCYIQNGQDWVDWALKKYVDFLCPMTYEYNPTVVRYTARNHRAAVGKDAVLYEGLGKASSQSRLTPEDVEEQARIYVEEGANGLTVFAYGAMTEEDFKRLQKYY